MNKRKMLIILFILIFMFPQITKADGTMDTREEKTFMKAFDFYENDYIIRKDLKTSRTFNFEKPRVMDGYNAEIDFVSIDSMHLEVFAIFFNSSTGCQIESSYRYSVSIVEENVGNLGGMNYPVKNETDISGFRLIGLGGLEDLLSTIEVSIIPVKRPREDVYCEFYLDFTVDCHVYWRVFKEETTTQNNLSGGNWIEKFVLFSMIGGVIIVVLIVGCIKNENK